MKNQITLLFSGIIATLLLSFASINSLQAQTYCTPIYGSVSCIAGMDISYLTLTGATITLANNSSCSTDGYGDYTSLNNPDLIQGQSYNVTVFTSYAVPLYCEVRIWIDYNNDGTFNDSEEIATTNGNGLAGTGGSGTFNFTVPFSATTGLRRMRTRLVYAGLNAIDPCDLENFGETEDYQVEIVAASSGCSGQPTAGTIMGEDTVSICSNANLNLIVTGATNTGEMSYQWELRTPAGTGPWTPIPGANSFTLNIAGSELSATSEYRFLAHCNNSDLSDVSNSITAILNTTPTECYCIPEGTNSTRYIDSFSTTTATQNINNNGSGYSVNGYGDFKTDTVKQFIGEDFDFNAVFEGGDYGIKVWADWDQDGIFDSSEIVFESTSFSNSILGTVSIPPTALLGATRMRVGISSMSLAGPETPCPTGYAFGEFEDYTLEILAESECSGTPEAGSLPLTAEVCSGKPFHLEAIGATSSVGTSGLVGQWQFRTPVGTGVWTDVPGATLPSATVLMPDTPVDVRFIYACGSNSDTTNVMTTSLLPAEECYCIPEGINPNRFINNFSTSQGIQNISNTNSGYSANGYSFFTSDTLIQKKGHPIQFNASIEGGNSGIKIWVDLDRNGHFTGVGELVYHSTGLEVSHSGSFTIPHTAVEGITRMRIGSNRSHTNGPPSPCETEYDKGEYEDYIIDIRPCDPPFVNLGSETTICEGTALFTGNTDSGISKLWNDNSTADSLIITVAGTYSVQISDVYGCVNSDTITVNVSPLPSADGIEVDSLGNNTYSFSASGVQNATTFYWDFGDGNTSDEVTPSHTFPSDEAYQISLILTNDCGSDTLQTTINDYPTGINQISLKEQFQVYPNPARDVITLQNSSTYKMSSIAIYNISGQRVYTDKAQSATQHQLNVNAYASGIYIAHITFEDGIWMTSQFEVVK